MGGEISGASAALSDTLVLVTTPSRQSMRSRTCLGAPLPLHSLVARTKGSPSAKLCAAHSICGCSWAAMKTRTRVGVEWTLDAMPMALTPEKQCQDCLLPALAEHGCRYI